MTSTSSWTGTRTFGPKTGAPPAWMSPKEGTEPPSCRTPATGQRGTSCSDITWYIFYLHRWREWERKTKDREKESKIRIERSDFCEKLLYIFLIFQDSKQLRHGPQQRCLDMDSATMELFLSECDDSSATQRWDIENVNKDRVQNWKIDKLWFWERPKTQSGW